MDSCRADIIVLFCSVPSMVWILYKNAKENLSGSCLDCLLFRLFNEIERNVISPCINDRFPNKE